MITTILSDSDGTLVNTLYLIRHGQYEASVEYLTNRGIPREDIPNYETYETYINQSVGGSTRETLEKTLRLMFATTHEHHLPKIDFDELNELLTSVQDRIAPLYIHPFHGLTELFTWLGVAKINLGIFTSGNKRMIMRHYGICLPALGYSDLYKSDEISVDERFDAFLARTKAVYGMPGLAVATCDDVAKTKPDPEGINVLLGWLGVARDEVLLLGDHAVDMQAAKAAGVHAIGISHGFGTPAELKEAGAIRTVDDLASIPKIIEAHNNGTALLF